SVIDGSSTVILASLSSTRALDHEILITPLVDPSRRGVELDLLATGSSIAWLANLLHLNAGEVERLALSHADPARSDAVFYPYLAGGEQGALWRDDVSGTINHVSLATTREDLALALYEGIAFETARCIRLLERIDHYDTVVSLAGSTSGLLGAAIVGAVVDLPVVAFRQHSPSLLGAALIGVDALGALDAPLAPLTPDVAPRLAGDYEGSLADKLSTYLAGAPATMDSLNLEARP
ncbi:MAG TPA: FGGY-family carbohydrate kinase, partial [Acidimicrobiales bacterium]|nr:FGGY-family carbohydrate kinase [Acidimicrobiales bacterium]